MTHATTLFTRQTRRVLTRRKLMMSGATFAIAAVLIQPQSAHAQAFQGSITGSTGSVTRVTPTSTTETITIGSNTATINWSPTNQQGSGTIDFLPTSNTATFTSSPGITDYTVLNRIVPTDATRGISLNGHIISTLQGTNTTGGRIWFYSPGGILIGSTAVIDVGSLLLTTNDLTGSMGSTSSFSGPAGSTSKIRVEKGAQINAIQPGSYVAMIAPRIEQAGKVRVNGSAAYVAAEQASLTINQGLFDIQVDVGTSDPNGIVHTGETSGPANTAASDNHGIYMVAVPKNQALEMLLGGTVGFDNAVSASVQNGQIVLSAGYGTSGANFSQSYLGGAIGGTPADMTISGGNFTSSVVGAATGNIEANGGGGTLAFAGDVSLQGLQSASLIANNGETVTVGGNLRISADDLRTFTTNDSEVGIDAQGGFASIESRSGGSVRINGSAEVSADAGSAINATLGTSGSSDGGSAMIFADGGTISIGGASQVSASALGAVSSGPVSEAGDAFGGFAVVGADNGGSVGLGGSLDLLANATGSFTTVCCGGDGGSGRGGRAGIEVSDNGSVSVNGPAFAAAIGTGGAVVSSPDGIGGNGDGGSAFLDATFGGSINFASTAQLRSDGIGGGATFRGGDGYGGSSDTFIDGGSIAASSDFLAYAIGFGGTGLTGGDGFGGSVSLEFEGGEAIGSGGSLAVGGQTWLEAIGQGGNGLDNPDGTGGQGGDGFGGTALFYVSPFQDSASVLSLNLHDTYVVTNANGGAGGNGLVGGNGGNAFSDLSSNGDGGFFGTSSTFEMFAGTGTVGDLLVYSTSRGGAGGAGSGGAGGNGGDATGGQSGITIGGNLTASSALSYDRAFGGDGGSGMTQGDGGSARGGSASIDVNEGGHLTGNVDIATTAFGGAGNVGGDADGGSSNLDVEGTLSAGSIAMDSNAFGGAGAIQGGNAGAGFLSFDLFGGSATISGAATLQADAFGGNASNGTAGSALGGTIFVQSADGGHLTGGDLIASASATSGNGASTGLAGGGQISISADSFGDDPATSIALGSLTLNANGTLGNGAVGGETFAYGGSIDLSASGALLSATSLSAQANGGNYGGSISLRSTSDYSGLAGNLAFGTVTGVANGNDLGGFIFARSDGGSTIGLGNASLTSRGDAGGQISLSAGSSGTGGGIFGTNLSLDTTGNILMALASGADISVSGTLDGNADGTISMLDNGTGGAIRAHIIDLDANMIVGNADVIADIIRFTSRSDMGLGNLVATDFITLTSGGDLESGDLNAANALTLMADGSVDVGNLNSKNVTINAAETLSTNNISGGAIRLTSGGAMGLGNVAATDLIALNAGTNLTAGDLSATNSLTATSSGNANLGNLNSNAVTINAGGALTAKNATGGSIRLTSGAGMSVGNFNATDLIVLNSGAGLNAGDLTATNSLTATSKGDANLGNFNSKAVTISAGGALIAGNGTGGAIRLTSGAGMTAGTLNATNLIALNSGAGLNAGDLSATNSLIESSVGNANLGSLNSKAVTVNAGGDLTTRNATGGAIRLTSGRDMNVGNFNATDLIALSSGRDLNTGNLGAANSLTLSAGRNLNAGNLASNLVAVNAGSNLTVKNVTAGTNATFTAGGLAKFTGIVGSPTITVTSGDIDITSGASLGVRGVTNLLTLNAVSNGLPILLGDGGSANAGATGQYHLDEDGDIRTASLVINAVGATSNIRPDVRIFDAEIGGTGPGGDGIGSVTLNTPGSILVQGDLRYLNAAPTDSLTLNAGRFIEVNTDLGSIVMTDSIGHLAGTLALNANDVFIGSGTILSQLEANPNFAGRDAALATNSGTANQDGFVRAGTITSRVGNGFFAQNSGTSTLFAGVDTGAGGLSITSTGTTPAAVVLYGRQTTANGAVVTNEAFLDRVVLLGTGGFTTDSAVNGCTIGATCGQPISTPGIDMASILGPLDETNSPDDEKKKDKDKDEEADDGSSVDPSLRLINTTPVNLDHQIDEPVTSGGDVVIGGSISN